MAPVRAAWNVGEEPWGDAKRADYERSGGAA
jgi:hypothetical protein